MSHGGGAGRGTIKHWGFACLAEEEDLRGSPYLTGHLVTVRPYDKTLNTTTPKGTGDLVLEF